MSRNITFKKRLIELGAKWTQWRDRDVVRDFGDPDAEYRAVRDGGVGLVDHSYRDTVVIMGDDAVPWLQGLVTSDLFTLEHEGAGQLTTAIDRLGRLIAEARILHMPNMLLLDLEPGSLDGGYFAHLQRNIFSEDVRLVDRSDVIARVSVFGEFAGELLDELCEVQSSVGALEMFSGTWGKLGDESIIIERVPWSGGPGFDVSCASDAALRVWDMLHASGDEVIPVGFETLETLRIEAGVPRFGVELSDTIIPLEAGLEHAISFNKGCYLGQEIIARLDSRGGPARLLRTLIFEGGAAPEVGADVEVDQRSVGSVVSSAWSPLLKQAMALAYVKRGHNDIGSEVTVEGLPARVEALGYALARAHANG